MMISVDDVRRLLESDSYRGALQVVSRDVQVERTGGAELSERELEEQATALDVAVSELGG
jgi:hypothetical protein